MGITVENERLLRAFMRYAHAGEFPHHDFRGLEEQAVALAHAHGTILGAFKVFPWAEGEVFVACCNRLSDFAAGWRAASGWPDS